ncbi:MAG TPA: hypothetical protein ENH94_02480 [Phycisphaerales bacterium]|nr:hypothetical protein [Phycisphaerales bacterium]
MPLKFSNRVFENIHCETEPNITCSASWYNQRIKAVKQSVREGLDRSPGLNNGQRYGIEKYLQSMKLRKVKAGLGKVDRVPTGEEIETLIEAADLRLGYDDRCSSRNRGKDHGNLEC